MTTYAWFVRGEKHAGLAQVSMAAVKRADRSADCVVATDEDGLTVPGARMVRFTAGLPLMVANVQAQIEVMHRNHVPVVFLDTDVLFLKPFPDQPSEAITVTWRDTVGGKLGDLPGGVADAMPYNYGVIGVLPGPSTIEAFLWLRERVRRLAPNLQQWYGNQVALVGLCGPRPTAGEVIEQREIVWTPSKPGLSVMVRKLPGTTWNYTPRDRDEDLSERGAVHFKGHTRPWMEIVAKRLDLPWRDAA